MESLLKKIAQIVLRKKRNKLQDLCIIGLGNPGEKYSKTRHNAGCDFIDLIASELQAEFKPSKKFDAEIADISYKEHQISSSDLPLLLYQ